MHTILLPNKNPNNLLKVLNVHSALCLLFILIAGIFVKQQLSSLDFVDGLIRKKLVLLTNNMVDNGGLDVVRALRV